MNLKRICCLLFCLFLLVNTHVFAASEAYEPNNTQRDAYPVLVNDDQKIYAFEYSGDEDWFVFYARKGTPYDIQILDGSVGKGINPALQVFNTDGELERDTHDFGFAGEGELLSGLQVPKDGLYYVKITNKLKKFSEDNHYALNIFIPFGPDNLLLKGHVLDQCTNTGISGASVSVSIVNKNTPSLFDEKATFSNGSYSFPLRAGSYSVGVTANGYKPQSQDFSEDTIAIDDLVIRDLVFLLQPVEGCEKHALQPANPDNAVAFYNEQTGQLTVPDVRIGGDQIIAAELQADSSGRFKLTRVTNLANPLSLVPAFYNYDTKRADIGRVYAFKQLYAIQLQNVGDNLFVLDGLPRLVIVK